MPLTYHFKCPNGHEFDAVAKLRSRCPECQTMVFRRGGITSSLTSMTPQLPAGEKIPPTSIPTSHKEDQPDDTEVSLKPATTLSAAVEKSEVLPKSLTRIVRQGRMPQPKVKKPVSIIKKSIAPKHIVPSVSRKPEGSRQHHTMEQPPQGPYWTQVKKKFFA